MEIKKSDLAILSRVLSRAFFTNPMTLYCLPDESERSNKLEWFLRIALRCGNKYGSVQTTDSEEGAAIWLSPSNVYLNLFQLLKQGFSAAPLRLGMGPLGRLFNCLNYFEKLQRTDMPDDNWHLFLPGVNPPRQGKGIGSRLIKPILQRADAEKTSCYLETDKPGNVNFFQKNGFKINREDDVPKGGPHFWTMIRETQ
jgi:ribosomal protein S18 acetylase RimI-like enzyme